MTLKRPNNGTATLAACLRLSNGNTRSFLNLSRWMTCMPPSASSRCRRSRACFLCFTSTAVNPAAMAKNFGTTHAGPNYGLIFTSTIASGLVGALVLSTNDPSGQAGWRNLMLWFGAISALAALVGATFRPRTGAAARGALQGRGPASSW